MCYELFDRFQIYVKIVRKSDEKVLYIILLLGNLMTSEAQAKCKIIEARQLYQVFVFYC